MNSIPQQLKLANIPTGYFFLITDDGLVQVHVGLFTNSMDPCKLDPEEFPQAAKEDTANDTSLTVQCIQPFERVISSIKQRLAGKEIVLKGKTDRTSIFMVA